MKQILLAILAIAFGYQYTTAQCAMCTPVSCSAQKPTGGLCNNLPDDTAGQYYDEVISFFMPKKLTDPTTLSQCGGCSSVDLRQIDIVGIQGLPPGLSYTMSQNGSYNVQNGDSLGCVRFCGTPVAPGTYYIIVNLLADVTANGTPIGSVQANDQPQQYRDTLVIFPGVSECPNTFSLGPCVTKACDSISVNLSASLTNPNCPNLISYDWSYGNGQTTKIKNPGVVKYNTPDTFPLTLTTTYYTYRVKSVTVNVSGGYTGDIEELTSLQKPDPYIRINSLGFSNRGASSDVNTATFNNLNLVIPDANCANALEIQVWDEDTGPPQGSNPLGSQDDLINTHNIYPSTPNQVYSAMNNSWVSVLFDTVATSSVTEVIDIIVHPHPPVPVLSVSQDSICTGDSTAISVSVSLDGYLVNWYLNDTIEILNADSVLHAKLPGHYTIKITNAETGCEEWSAPVAVAVGQSAPANVNIIFNGTQLFVSPFPSSGFAVEWYYNGNLVVGETGKFLPNLGNGLYDAYVYNVNYPGCKRAANQFDLQVSSVNDLAVNAVEAVNVFPNPNSGKFTVQLFVTTTSDVNMSIANMLGQDVYTNKIENLLGDYSNEVDLFGLEKGMYILTVEAKGQRFNKRIAVQ
ncbi:MAG: T9SS type A sorting domain-containing protein [Chitinophagales bacterium]|nr:T9SS type A sorting domain-containing protein [Chitinophagales bacterium]